MNCVVIEISSNDGDFFKYDASNWVLYIVNRDSSHFKLKLSTLNGKLWSSNNFVLKPIFYDEFLRLRHVYGLRALLSGKDCTEYIFQYTLPQFDPVDKIIFRGGGKDMVYVVWFQSLMTKMLHNEGNISKNKVAEVETLANTKHKRNIRLWCGYNFDNNLLIDEYITSKNMFDTLNGKETLLGWHYNYVTSIVTYVAKVLAYLHHNCVLPIVHKHVRSNKLLSGVAKVVIFESKVVVFMYVTMGSYGYVALVRRRERKKWDPGRQLAMCRRVLSFKFKQWDPGKIRVVGNFYILEDKVDFEGVSNVMIQPKSEKDW
ncbi:hypothetical protein TSUD_101480 [Trifolium subterraneum]|uniref:Protein kinase domain-containing protein n=1 Tax=Trifolium subterraneum TaxID=3900 RepID=A0A2Z6NRX9_TRISU|nr:hypothetical protein TSUD_101480 [Trifolium subterraneum]